MKSKTKILFGSAMTIVMCTSLIAGSTFALFTSESKTNIAITSGKVDVSATAKLTRAFSAKWDGTGYTDEYRELNPDGTATFACNGVASYDGSENTISLNSIAPGDGVEFDITATNNSSIAIKYQVIVTFKDGGPTEEKKAQLEAENPDAVPNPYALYHALKITVGEWDELTNANFNRTTAVSEWSATVPAGENIPDIPVRIELPWDAGDELQNEFCDLSIGLYAVQANGHDETNQDVHYTYYAYNSNIDSVFGWLEDGDTVKLAENITDTDTLSVDKDITVDLNSWKLILDYDEVSETGGMLEAYDGATVTLTGNGSVEIGEHYHNQPYHHYIISYNDVGTTTTLNIDCEVDLDNTYELSGYATASIWAEAKTSPDEEGTPGSKAVINITDHAYIHRAVADGAAVAVGANGEVNMTGGKIEVTPTEGSVDTDNTATAVWLDERGAQFNLSGGEIVAKGYNVSAVNMWQAWTKFCMTGGKITLDIDVTGAKVIDAPCNSSAVEVCGTVEFLGGTIEVMSNISEEESYNPDIGEPYACAFFANSDWLEEVTFGEGATIIVHKTGTGGSEHNYSFLNYRNEIPYFDESDDVVTVPEEGASGFEALPEGWTYEGTITLVRE